MHLYEHSAEQPEPLRHEVQPHQRLTEIIAIKEEELIFIENQDEVTELSITVEELVVIAGPNPHIHRHRCRSVEVEVFYNGVTHTHRFSPATRLEKVVAWAVKAYDINPVDAVDMTLHRPGDETDLDVAVHIGSLLQSGTCELKFTLGPIHTFLG